MIILTEEKANQEENSPKSPLSEAEKHHNFQVTPCLHNDTTIADFSYIESE